MLLVTVSNSRDAVMGVSYPFFPKAELAPLCSLPLALPHVPITPQVCSLCPMPHELLSCQVHLKPVPSTQYSTPGVQRESAATF